MDEDFEKTKGNTFKSRRTLHDDFKVRNNVLQESITKDVVAVSFKSFQMSF